MSQKWLQDYVNQKYAQIPRQVKVSEKKAVRERSAGEDSARSGFSS